MFDNGPTEWHIQFQFFKWLETTYPELREVSFAISNEKGDRSVSTMRNLKMIGLTAGVPDVCICHPISCYHGMFIEFKSAIGKLSETQKEMLSRLDKRGYKCIVCYSTGEAINAVIDYLKGVTAQSDSTKRISGRPFKMTASKIESAKKLIASGVSPKEVAHSLGISIPTFYRWIPAPWKEAARKRAKKQLPLMSADYSW